MKRRYRVLLTVGIVATSIGLVALLVLLGTAAQGPLSALLEGVGRTVSRVESSAAHRLRGPGRAQRLSEYAVLRENSDSLRMPGRVLLGAYDAGIPTTLDGVLAIEDSIDAPLPLIQIYTAWGDRQDQRFPDRLISAVSDLGSIPVITWEPWLTDFENRLHPDLPLRDDRDRGGLAAIARGDYDFYVDQWARDAAEYGRPILLRFAHEMNDPYRYPWGPQNNAPADFIAAWHHVRARFAAAGAANVVWVWAPHIAYEGYDAFYPGDDAVDWAGTGVLNYGTVANWSDWWSFEEIFGQRYEKLAAFGKPIMIAELGTLAVGGDRAAWITAALTDLPRRYPAVKAVLFFHVPRDNTITYQALDWSFLSDPASLAAIRTSLRSW